MDNENAPEDGDNPIEVVENPVPVRTREPQQQDNGRAGTERLNILRFQRSNARLEMFRLYQRNIQRNPLRRIRITRINFSSQLNNERRDNPVAIGERFGRNNINVEEIEENEPENDRRDELFEEYIRQQPRPEEVEIFNTELPTEHSYLGAMDRVSGVDFFESGKIYHIPVCAHHSIVYPGETLPMIMAESIFDRSEHSNDGLTFGIVFWEYPNDSNFYGVICQVYERGVAQGNITIKSRAHQRFIVVRQKDGSYTKTKYINQRTCVYSDVRILPEVQLPDPLMSINSNNLRKFVFNNKQHKRLRDHISKSTAWPTFVYNQYETVSVTQKVQRFIEMLKLQSTLPTDPVLLTFWLARNIPVTDEDRIRIFLTNSVTRRMLILGKSLDVMCYFVCKRCKYKVAKYNEIFAMSKQGVQTNYCNPSGYIHETLTVYKTIVNSVYLVERASTEFSWFPGYAWQIVMCNGCSCHLGWKFIATNKNLMPRVFYGLSGKSIGVQTINTDLKPPKTETMTVPDGLNLIPIETATVEFATHSDNVDGNVDAQPLHLVDNVDFNSDNEFVDINDIEIEEASEGFESGTDDVVVQGDGSGRDNGSSDSNNINTNNDNGLI